MNGLDIFSHSTKDLALVARDGVQSADNQLLMNTVEAELAFGFKSCPSCREEDIETRTTSNTQSDSYRSSSLSKNQHPFGKKGEKQKVAMGQCWLCVPVS